MAAKPEKGRGTASETDTDTGTLACIFYVLHFATGGVFLGALLILASNQFHGLPNTILGLAGSGLIGLMFNRGMISGLILCALAVCGYIAAVLAITELGLMATNGVSGPDQSGMSNFNVSNYLIFGILWLLFGIPYRAFRFGIDQRGEGAVQGVVTISLATGAALLTGSYILLLHANKGPFSGIHANSLIVGDIFTVFLLIPIYRAIATACWRRGIIGSLSPRDFLARWQEAAIEIDTTTMGYYRKLHARKRENLSDSTKRADSGSASNKKLAENNSKPRQTRVGSSASTQHMTRQQRRSAARRRAAVEARNDQSLSSDRR